MAFETATASVPPAEGIKHVPQEASARRAVRAMAAELAGSFDRVRPPTRGDLERHGEAVLSRLGLPRAYLGFAMVALSNAFWRPIFEAIPTSRRLFLLPHCLSDRAACRGTYDSVGLRCADCGSCRIADLRREAEQLGYSVIVAEGTSSALMNILDGRSDAILGVACLDSLEKSFSQVVALGVPHMALPLLRDGCVDTEAEIDEILQLLAARSSASSTPPRSYVPLLRETARMFREPTLTELLLPYEEAVAEQPTSDPRLAETSQISLDWLREGGKRLRPFVTLAAYAVARHGAAILERGDDAEQVPMPVRRLALAIEALHKASLAHDDIEDDDAFRYGLPTLHEVHGVAQAINVGDYLIGLGYRLIAGEAATLGGDCTGDILNQLSRAHLELCRGQGRELAWQRQPHSRQTPLDVLTVYAMKTAPAFEAAIYAGLRAAESPIDADALRRFSNFLGEAFQIRNDLEDWRDDVGKRCHGLDALAERPTILRAFATETEHAGALDELACQNGMIPPDHWVARVKAIYERSGAFAKADQLLRKLRAKALDAAGEFSSDDLQELMRFLVRVMLPEPVKPEISAS